MAIMIPNYIAADAPKGERIVFYKFQKSKGTDGWIVMHSFNLKEHERKASSEIDMLVIVPDWGIVVLEIKGSDVVRRNNGKWDYGYSAKSESPFVQASTSLKALRKDIESKEPSLKRLLYISAVIFTYVDFNESSSEWHDWQYVNRSKLEHRDISQIIKNVLQQAHEHTSNAKNSRYWYDNQSSRPTAEQVGILKNILRRDFEFIVSPKIRVDNMERHISRMTDDQMRYLESFVENDQVVVRGLAGTGKTILALEQARRCAANGQRVLILCYNRLLERHLTSNMAEYQPDDGEKIHCSTIHKLARQISGVTITGEEDDDFWKKRLPANAVDRLLRDEYKIVPYDVLIVDEAQDVVTNPYLEMMDCLLKGGLNAGKWLMFGDFDRQAIFLSDSGNNLGQFNDILNEWGCRPFRVMLTVNCRNVPTVSETVSLVCNLNPGYSACLATDCHSQALPDIYKSRQEQQSKLISHVEMLLKAHSPEDIVILTFRKDGITLPVKIGGYDVSPYEIGIKTRIRFSTISAFKGLESKAIIIADIDRLDSQDIALLYVGMSRAKIDLVMLINESLRNAYRKLLQR